MLAVLEPRAAALILLMLAAAAFDWRVQRVPNILTGGGALAGIALAAAGIGAGPSIWSALEGCALGLAMLMPLYVLNATGAGDVKLMAAVGAFVGPLDATYVLLLTFVAGGPLALAWAAWRHGTHMPYAPAMCIGTLACIALRQPFSS